MDPPRHSTESKAKSTLPNTGSRKRQASSSLSSELPSQPEDTERSNEAPHASNGSDSNHTQHAGTLRKRPRLPADSQSSQTRDIADVQAYSMNPSPTRPQVPPINTINLPQASAYPQTFRATLAPTYPTPEQQSISAPVPQPPRSSSRPAQHSEHATASDRLIRLRRLQAPTVQQQQQHHHHPRPSDSPFIAAPRLEAVSAPVFAPIPLPEGIFHQLVSCPGIIHSLQAQLDATSLIALFSMSSAFRAACNAHFTTMIRSNARVHAPHAMHVFRWKAYASLCMLDPAHRKLKRDPRVDRDVPSFRWLRMVTAREADVRSIVRELAKEGHRLPRGVKMTLCKVWFVMDIPDSIRRVALFHNRDFWNDRDLFLATMFLIKLDMRLTDPREGGRLPELRNCLLAQRGLHVLARVLRREALTSEADWIVMLAEWNMKPPPRYTLPNFVGVPTWKLGGLEKEFWTPTNKPLIPVDKLILREAVRRQLGFHRMYMSMVMWGYIDEKGNDVDVFLKEDEDEDDIDMSLKGLKVTESGQEQALEVDKPIGHEEITGLIA